jgi:hypothetical protein
MSFFKPMAGSQPLKQEMRRKEYSTTPPAVAGGTFKESVAQRIASHTPTVVLSRDSDLERVVK